MIVQESFRIYGALSCRGWCFFCALWQVGSWESAVITVSDLCKRGVRANREAAKRTEETSHTTPAMGPQRWGSLSDTLPLLRHRVEETSCDSSAKTLHLCASYCFFFNLFGSKLTTLLVKSEIRLNWLLTVDNAPFVKGLPGNLLVISAVC